MSRLYQATDCTECPLRKECHNAEGNRIIRVKHRLNEYKKKVRELLTSQRGIYHRSIRPIEPEAVFGQIKANHIFRRFHLRSLQKVNVEFGLVALAHNLRKLITLKGDLLDGYAHCEHKRTSKERILSLNQNLMAAA